MPHSRCKSFSKALILLFITLWSPSAFADDDPVYDRITYAGTGDFYSVYYKDPDDYTLSGWGLIDASGNEVIPCIYDCSIKYGDSGYAIVCDGDSARIIDIEGYEIFAAPGDELDMAGSDEPGVCYAILYKDDNPTQVIRLPENKVVTLLPANTGVCGDIVQNRIPAYRFSPEGYQFFGFYDLSGQEVIPLKYFMVGSFSEGLASFMIPKNGSFNIPDFSNNLYGNLIVGFIDLDGNIVIPPVFIDDYVGESRPQYELSAPRFENGRAMVCVAPNDYSYSYIDRAGNILDGEATSFGSSPTGLKRINSTDGSDLYGFSDASGCTVIPCRYWFALEFNNNYAIVHDPESGNYSLIDASGNIVLPNIANGWE